MHDVHDSGQRLASSTKKKSRLVKVPAASNMAKSATQSEPCTEEKSRRASFRLPDARAPGR